MGEAKSGPENAGNEGRITHDTSRHGPFTQRGRKAAKRRKDGTKSRLATKCTKKILKKTGKGTRWGVERSQPRHTPICHAHVQGKKQMGRRRRRQKGSVMQKLTKRIYSKPTQETEKAASSGRRGKASESILKEKLTGARPCYPADTGGETGQRGKEV